MIVKEGGMSRVTVLSSSVKSAAKTLVSCELAHFVLLSQVCVQPVNKSIHDSYYYLVLTCEVITETNILLHNILVNIFIYLS